MTSPQLSPPVLYTPSNLRSEPNLVTEITDLVNDAFTRSKLSDPVKWGDSPQKRFPSNDVYFEMLGQEGLVAVIFDDNAEEPGIEKLAERQVGAKSKKVVAVAAAIPWQGGWKKEGAGVEEGWEIKAVAVDGDAKYLRRGLASQLYNSLEQHLVFIEKYRPARSERLTLWILAAECINGVYWRKRGYSEVRKETCQAPIWGCETSFEMIVLRKDVSLDFLRPERSSGCQSNINESATRKELEVK
jgi:ribosomal protein S18 acetylase RimI-like enzyme